MSIRFFCPLGHRLVVPDDRAGKKGRCPICQQKVYVPVAAPQPSGRPKRPPVGPPASRASIGPASGPNRPARSAATSEPAGSLPDEALADPYQHDDEGFVDLNLDTMLGGSVFVGHPDDLWREPIAERSAAELRFTALGLAAAILALVVLSVVPVFVRPSGDATPAWVWLVWLMAALQLSYAVAVVVRTGVSLLVGGTWLFAVLAAVYGMGAAIVMATPAGEQPLLGLAEVRQSAGGWCLAQIMLLGMIAYFCGALAGRWARLPREAREP